MRSQKEWGVWATFLTRLAGAFMGLTLSAAAGAAEELRLLTWEGYADDAWVKPFEEEHGVTVTRTYVGSNDEYMAKLAAGGGEYDLVVIVSSLTKRAIEAGFVEPLDLNQIPNFKDLFPGFQKLDFNQKDGVMYGAPTFWGTDPVTVDARIIPEGNDFGVLFDPKYKGKIAMWDDVSTIADVANYMGYEDIWTLDDEQLAAVKAKMITQKPLVRKYWSQAGEVIELFASGEIVASNSWNYITQALQDQGHNVREFVPSRPIGWVDSHFIVKGSKKSALAHAFINHMLDPKMMALIGARTGYTVTNPKAKDHMDPAVWQRLYMDEGPEVLKTIQFWQDIPRRAKYLEVWNEIKAAVVQ